MAKNEPFRDVAVGHARPLPLRCGPCDLDVAKVYKGHVKSAISQTLKRHGVSWTSVALLCRWRGDCQKTQLNTLLIETTMTDTSQWKESAMDLFRLFREAGMNSDRIEVEISNPLHPTDNTSHVLRDETIASAIEAIKEKIFTEVKSRLGSSWSSVAFHTRTPRVCQSSKQKPTVIVFVREGSTADFSKLQDSLMDSLAQSQPQIFVEILAGTIT